VVLDPGETLLLGGGDDLAVANDGRGRIAEGGQAEDVH
jgi:hypothetical protein